MVGLTALLATLVAISTGIDLVSAVVVMASLISVKVVQAVVQRLRHLIYAFQYNKRMMTTVELQVKEKKSSS